MGPGKSPTPQGDRDKQETGLRSEHTPQHPGWATLLDRRAAELLQQQRPQQGRSRNFMEVVRDLLGSQRDFVRGLGAAFTGTGQESEFMLLGLQ